MPRPKQNVTKHTINLREGDYATLQECFADSGGAAIVIRKTVSKIVDRLNAGDEVEVKEDLSL